MSLLTRTITRSLLVAIKISLGMIMKYSILIQWSEEDNAYIASLPEWGKYARTHGNTYQEALDNAQEVLEELVDIYTQENKPLPSPKLLQIA